MSLTRSITRPLTRPLTRAITQAGAGGGFDPASLFSGGVKGIALDLTDMSTLYQDIARTTLVTSTGQPIGSASDISGNGVNPAAAANDATRPTYNGYATFDGGNDGWATPAIDFSGTDDITVIAGILKNSDAATAMLVELTASSATNNGAFHITAPTGAGAANFEFASRGTTRILVGSLANHPAPVSRVVTGIGSISPASAIIRVDSVQEGINTGSQGTGSYANAPVYIGRRGGASLPFNGRIYRLIVIGRTLTSQELANAEAWCGDPFS